MKCYLEGCENTEGEFLCNEHESYLIDSAKEAEALLRLAKDMMEARIKYIDHRHLEGNADQEFLKSVDYKNKLAALWHEKEDVLMKVLGIDFEYRK